MDIISSDTKGNKNLNETQILNKIISLNRRPINIIVPNEQIKPDSSTSTAQTPKIPRPANAFMIYANENRKKVAKEFPQDSNKEISCRLGAQWKNLSTKEKEKYFSMAKLLDADHKRKYPDYVYNPKEARIRKAMRERERSMGAAQMGNARSRRLNWPKTAVHMPGPGPNSHPEHLLGGPSKELCSALRAEMEHGFLAGNAGYVYNPQQYSFSPQADYATYIQVAPGLSNWVQNYNMQQQGNQLAINQWNQYQNERLRAQQAAGTSYMMAPQPQAPDYQHVDMPSTNMMHMGPSLKPTIHQNIENAANEVERYININSTPTNMEVRSEPLTVEPPRRVANSTPIPPEPTETSTNTSGDNSGGENNSPPELNISSVTAMSEVDAQINMENNGSNSDSYGGISLFEDSNIAEMKALNTSVNSKVNPAEMSVSLPQMIFQKPEMAAPLHPVFPIDFVPTRPPYLPQNGYMMNQFIPDLQTSYPEATNIIINKTEFPVDFSAQKYYESVANGNFDGPILPDENFGYISNDGYNFLTFPNPQEMSNPFPPNQFEVTQFLTNPNELIKNENNYILDLSQVSQNESKSDEKCEK